MAPDRPTPFAAAQLWRAMQAGEAVLVDVRTAAEFAAGHALGAVHLPLYEEAATGRQLQADFVDRARALRAATPVGCVLVMSCRTGARSRQALQVLQACGLSGVADFPGGWDGKTDSWGRITAVGWLAAGLPVCAQVSDG